jgi:hypothetical protein
MNRLLTTLLVLPFALFTTTLFSQETTATLNGAILSANGEPVEGASVALTHVPTGYQTTTQTNRKGIFVVPNLKPGGPYTVIVSFVGMEEQKFENINLTLGNNPDLNVTLKPAEKNLQEVVVNATGRRTIGGISIGRQQMNVLPTLGRSLSDFTRLTPQSNNNSFAGTNFRYNNLTIDGSVNNDAIGFSNSFGGVSGGGQSGASGSGTRTNPYSLDAIQEVQVQLAPYDVKLGNFTGGSINAVTKSGTNDFHGSIYGYGRNQALMGKSVDGLKTKIGSTFHDYQYGASLGGPIVKNKAFFFVNFEQTRRQEPSFYNVGDPGAAITATEAEQIVSKLHSLNYDPGSYLGAYKLFTKSDKLFARLDFNLSPKNILMLRGIYTNGWGNNLERTSTNFQFGSTDFTQYDKNINLVAELKTKVSSNLSNQLNVSYVHVHEYRHFPEPLAPFMDIDNGRIWAGTWREASIYNMTQQTIELSDNVTLAKGINKFTFGTHNEFYDLTYGFINSWNGRWEYSRGVSSFLSDNPSRVRGAFTRDPKIPNDRDVIYNDPPNPFKVSLLSAYGEDEITLNKKFKLTPGLRIDYSFVDHQPGVDSNLNSTVANSHYAPPTYTNTPFSELKNEYLGKASLSPRLGFNFDVKGNGSVVLRGGTGIFLGRMPFAWMGYGYTLNGYTWGNIDWNNIAAGTYVPLAINPYGLKDTVTKYGGASRSTTRELDVVDNNFKLPRVWRSDVAMDYKFGKGYKFTVDLLYTKTLYDVKFQQINLFDSVEYFSSGPTQSPIYVARGSGTNGKYNPVYSNVFFLSNTTEGYRYNITAQLSKTTNGIKAGAHRTLDFSWNVAYTYGVSKDISNGIRNSWESNFNLNPAISPNDPQLGFSNFDLRHRIVGTVGTNFHWNAMNATSLTFFYAGQSGSPYTLVYQSPPGSGGSNAPLPYIPRDQSDIRLADYKLNGQTYTAAQQWIDLNDFIESDSYLKTRRGEYAERNGMRTPWNHELDMKLMHSFHLSKQDKSKTLDLSFDLFNVLNLLSNSWGHITFVTNVNQYDVNFLKYATDANGKAVGKPTSGYLPTFNFVKPTGLNNHYYTVDPINSRWQGQLGVKLNF